MLAHFQNFDFSPLLEYFCAVHVLLLHLLNSHLVTRLLVLREFNLPELTFSEGLPQFVEIEEVGVPDDVEDGFAPFLAVRGVLEVQNPRLVGGNEYFEGVQLLLGFCIYLLLQLLDKGAHQTMHQPMHLVFFVSITI